MDTRDNKECLRIISVTLSLIGFWPEEPLSRNTKWRISIVLLCSVFLTIIPHLLYVFGHLKNFIDVTFAIDFISELFGSVSNVIKTFIILYYRNRLRTVIIGLKIIRKKRELS